MNELRKNNEQQYPESMQRDTLNAAFGYLLQNFNTDADFLRYLEDAKNDFWYVSISENISILSLVKAYILVWLTESFNFVECCGEKATRIQTVFEEAVTNEELLDEVFDRFIECGLFDLIINYIDQYC